jgi:AraC-like DNA-binding protein
MNEPFSLLNQAALATLDLRILAVQRITADRWWNFQQVVSPFSRLWHILEGEATVEQGGQQFRLRPGTLHLVPAFMPHNCHCPRRFRHFYLHFSARLPTGIDLFAMLDFAAQVKASPTATAWCERLEQLYPERRLPCFDPFRKEYQSFPAELRQPGWEEPPADWFEAQGLLRLLLAPFLKTAPSHEGLHARVARRFLAVQEFIQARMREPITLADMAAVAGLHPAYFSDRFAELVGVRPMEYLVRRRIERAQFLLLTTPVPIKAIAHEVGLPDAGHFSRVFSSHCGASPTSYRLKHRA